MNYEKAFEIASEAHKNRVDKAGKPYILHSIRVAQRCVTENEKIVALLHDVLEDSEISADDLLRFGFSHEVVIAVQHLTRNEKEDYSAFIKRCAKNPIAHKVKICDLVDNMDISRLKNLTDADFVRLKKYLRAYLFLVEIK